MPKIFLEPLLPTLPLLSCPESFLAFPPNSSAFPLLSLVFSWALHHLMSASSLMLFPIPFICGTSWGAGAFLMPVVVYSNLLLSNLCCLAPLSHRSTPPDVHTHLNGRGTPRARRLELNPVQGAASFSGIPPPDPELLGCWMKHGWQAVMFLTTSLEKSQLLH